jgi:fermentation-respiration switch protein FrsA (DUF1100 family)
MKRWRWLAGLLVFGLVAGRGASWWIGGELVAPVLHPVPQPGDLPVRSFTIPSDGDPLAAWWIPAQPHAPAVLLLHAVRADRSTKLSRARLLREHGYSVLLVDLQAHGESPGDAITFGWRESEDARAALGWLRRSSQAPRVGVIGCSLGGASVLLGPQPAGFDAVVLEAVYPRLGRAVENRIRLRLGPLAPVLSPLLLMQLRLRLGIDPTAVQPIDGIGRLGAPVLVAAGSADRHTSLAESQEMFAAAREPRKLWVVEGAAHQDFLAYDPRGYVREVVTFLTQHLKPAA